MGTNAFPEGKFMAPVKVGPKGQIVIPAEVRDLLGIEPGDILLLMADVERGIAIPRQDQSQQIFNAINRSVDFGGEGK